MSGQKPRDFELYCGREDLIWISVTLNSTKQAQSQIWDSDQLATRVYDTSKCFQQFLFIQITHTWGS